MDDMSAFDRQIASEVLRAAGPSEPVDVLAVFAVITTATQSPKWRFGSMFSATKFLVAGAIVALFGGFLLAGLLTQPSDEQVPAVGASAPATAEPGAFDPAGSLAEARRNHTATLLPDGRVLIVGGDSRDSDYASAEVWDPATESFESFGPAGKIMQRPRGATATFLLDGRLLIIGGGDDDDGRSGSAEVWDPATGSLRPAGSLTQARSRHTATLLPDGRVLVVGGLVDDEDLDGAAEAEIWDPATESFGSAGSLIEVRNWHTATLLPDGRVLVVGGYGVDTAEVWDPATASFEAAGSLAGWRYDHTATLLPDGRVLVVGGVIDRPVECGARCALAQVWDPARASFEPAGSLADRRHGHTATLLPDGRVLVVGGSVDSEHGLLATAEIWTPTDASASAAAESPPDLEPPDVEARSTASDILPGVDLVTEEVEPGVYRVLSDGAGHDLVAEPPAGLTVTPNGSVWLLRSLETVGRVHTSVDAVFQLGREGAYSISPTLSEFSADLAVGTDGVAWLGTDQGGSVLASLDGSTWSDPTWPDGADGVGAIEASPDGAVSLIEESFDPTSRVARIVDGAWTVLPPLDDPSLAGFFDGEGPGLGGFRDGYLAASADGIVWLASGGHQGSELRHRIASSDGLLHFDGTAWEAVDLPPGGYGVLKTGGNALGNSSETVEGWLTGPLALGTDGTLWVYLERPGTREIERINDPNAGHLARLDADGWSLFSATADDVPKLVTYGGYEAAMTVDGSGRVWVAPAHRGVFVFDGSDWRQYLDGLDVNHLGVSHDGSVFATALSDCLEDVADAPAPGCANPDFGGAGLFVITPEAMASAQ